MATVEREGGGYVTRGRAQELLDRMEAIERLVDERLGAMEQRIDELVAFEYELLRKRLAAELELLQTHRATGRKQT